MLNWIIANEPLWLFVILSIEAVFGLYTCIVLTIEYFYDRQIEESKYKRRKVNKSKVKISIDKDGNARIVEAPKDMNVEIDHTGE